ncbi:hypothetical protein [Cochleicola gelatinilyticus]|uniref:Uncharacterized protein n=1 Tax=Cochleicola gelatinilyticus TaxID=1763537 RepID=A0A167HRC6_9FLAO|nr:hypothetical protein [Cochleicola gelatinilyticus]OAB78883.1 hypothetical protein ULVI_09895 [Cochleicola gelatinilyticus]
MKFLLFLFLVIAANGCTQTDVQTIEYTEITRGSYYTITATESSITVVKNRDASDPLKVPMKASDWEELTDLLSDIELASIPSLDVPSKAHQFDGAALTNIKVLTLDEEIVSPTFDDNNPPSRLKPIIDKLTELANAAK